jgi:hypothetical protein
VARGSFDVIDVVETLERWHERFCVSSLPQVRT